MGRRDTLKKDYKYTPACSKSVLFIRLIMAAI